ncbi:MAG: chemotaxis protein CheW [Nitrospirota bacterium]
MKQKVLKKANKPINWDNVNQRLEAARASSEKGIREPGGETAKGILKERARLLSLEPEGKASSGEHFEVVEFVLSQERYAIPTEYVREVYPFDDCTPVPCTPPFVLGIINVRGRILSVIDLRQFFGLPEKGLSDLNKVIILHSDELGFGILADSVTGLRNVRTDDLQPSLPTLTGIREEYLKGVTRDRVTVLDAEKLLLDRGLIVHEDV